MGTSPIVISKLKADKISLFEMATIKLRQWTLIALVMVGFFLPMTIWAIGNYVYRESGRTFTDAFTQFMWEGYLNVWEFPILGIGFGWVISFGYHRYLRVYISSIKRKLTMRQSGDELSDIRAEKGQLESKNYDPRKHYKSGHMFFGLDEQNSPIYVPLEEWEATHQRYVGPTQTGKGVEIGVQLDQAIRGGQCVIFIDPKPDKHAKAIMRKACEETGRNFVELDLNPEGRGKYAPFMGGSLRDRRTRLMYVLGLHDTGDTADFYKSGERAILDKLLESWDGHLDTLRQLLRNPDIFELVKRSLNYINEWLSLSTFQLDKRKTGFSVERSLCENAVVYIRGNLDDEVINKATTVLLMEIVQECKRLDPIRKTHVFLATDEIAFLINEKIADSLATVAGFRCNMLLAYQSEGDLLNLKDKTQNAQAIASRVKTNCKISLYYMAMDYQTAKTMADESGTIQKAVTRSQKVDIGKHQQEEWDNSRDIHRVEEALITINKAKMLPARVGILYRPAKLATPCFTAWVPIDLNRWGDNHATNVTKSAIETVQNKPAKKKQPKPKNQGGEVEKRAPSKSTPVDLSAGLQQDKEEQSKEGSIAKGNTKSVVIDDF